MIILFAAFIGIAILSLWWGVTAEPPAARANLMAGLDLPADEQAKSSFLPALGRVLRRLLPTGYVTNLNANLMQAGYPRGLDLSRFLAIKTLLPVFLGVFALAVGQPALALLFVLSMFFLPDYWLVSERDKRQIIMRDAAADTIDQLTVVVEAGMGFDAALLRVAATNKGPLAAELQHTVDDMRAGLPRDMALKGLADRTQISEIRHLVTALTQAQRHGTPLADTLRVQAGELRDKRVQRIEEKAAKLATKMLFPIIFCFMPVVFVVILVPALSSISPLFNHVH